MLNGYNFLTFFQFFFILKAVLHKGYVIVVEWCYPDICNRLLNEEFIQQDFLGLQIYH